MYTSERGTCGEQRTSVREKSEETKLVCGAGVLTDVVRQMPASPGRTQHIGREQGLLLEPSVAWVTLSGKSKMRGLVGFVLALRGMRLAP